MRNDHLSHPFYGREFDNDRRTGTPRPDGRMLPLIGLVDGDHTTVATGKDDKTVVLEE